MPAKCSCPSRPASNAPSPSLASIATRSAILALGCACFAADAQAIVVSGLQSLPRPDASYVGNFNGASGVAIGPDWIVTAKHVGGAVGSYFGMHGQTYQAVEVVNHQYLDLQLVRLDRALPGFHPVTDSARLGDPVILGGFGVTAAAALPNNAGFDWAGPRAETWGANVIEQEGFLLGVRFDAPTNPASVPFEANFALYDSGGGLFIVNDEGMLELAGVAVSVSGWNGARWGNSGLALNASLWRNWALPIVNPAQPISSAIEAPRSMIALGLVPEAVALPLLALTMMRRVRRQHDVTDTHRRAA
jgi:hypothetical protein